MKSSISKESGSVRFINFLPYLLFCAGTFIYFAFFAEQIFFYQEKQSLFILTKDFLTESLRQPGGFLIYAGKFLSSFFFFPVAGALIASAILFLIILTISGILANYNRGKNLAAAMIAGVALFYLQADYAFLLYNTLGILIQLAAFLLVIKLPDGKKSWISLVPVPFLYYLTGGFSWMFAVMLTLHLAFHETKKGLFRIAGLWSLCLAIFLISREYIFFVSPGLLLSYPYSGTNTGSQAAPFLSVVVLISVIPLLTRIRIKPPQKKEQKGWLPVVVQSAFVLLLIAVASVLKYDGKTRHYFHVEKLFYQKRYNELVNYNLRNPSANSLTSYLTNIALCETGRLNDLLFSFPQSKEGNTLYLKWEMIGEVLRQGGYFYYTVGIINEAHRWAYENMVMKGYTPEGMKMLIRTEIINGNYTVASKYINLLKKTFFYRREAEHYEKLLFNDSAVETDSELGLKRKNKLATDFFSITDDPYINVARVLALDSLNRNAFEYRMAFMLLKKDYQGIASALPGYGNLGYSRFPRHVEEAAAALSVFNNGNLPYLGKLGISRETENGWTQYLTLFQQYGTDAKAAEPALRRQFGNTFWYWAFYR